MTANYDYLVVGGGTVGCVLASRLSQAGHKVAVVEAGPENYDEHIMSPVGAPHLHDTPVEYNYKSTPQPKLNNRIIPNYGGKLLGGSSSVNYGLWTRGHSADYDAWAELVGDKRWSYSGMLKYFKKSEKHHNPDGDKEAHGFDGPISTICGTRKYPLTDSTLKAFEQSGLKLNPKANEGDPLGIGAFTENWKDHQRQPSSKAYDLSRAKIFTNSPVAKILVDSSIKAATGVQLVNGQILTASKEVIVSCGAVKTPQLLMLSGIGPAEHLKSLGIESIADLPVGENLHDHFSGTLFWKLRYPEQGLAIGSPNFNKPEYFTGNPIDWLVSVTIPKEDLQKVIKTDKLPPDDPYVRTPRAHIELMTTYAPVTSAGAGFRLPFDGTHISTPVIMLLPTSRGSIKLASIDPLADPIIDPNYLDTEADWAAMRTGFRAAIRAMETPEARTFVEGETAPPGYPQLTSKSTDAEVDDRLRLIGSSFYQNAGTASMGSVVDTECKVKGIEGLRVCDASILPLPIASHYQAGMYAIGEAAAAIVLGENTA